MSVMASPSGEPRGGQNIGDLAAIENEVFDFTTSGGKLVPVHKMYWDLQSDGSVPVFLRLE